MTVVLAGLMVAVSVPAQADPGRPNQHVEGDLPNGNSTVVQYSTYRTIPSAWRNVDLWYANKITGDLRLGLRNVWGYQITTSVQLGGINASYRLAANMAAGTEFAINGRAVSYLWASDDQHWAGELYW
ncbi:hypothetical protein [Streptomyces sp. H39-C1]|uniref:hypothetical protein n=1 Tax=Streptomyces sp. H39-C1 TaxID=3004355 RepID=UPI0022AF0B97|nr:hypothetical protein [Streptomyces sp. H39-C1]MCZ4101164.1 hypothetical protein [Streptomyces sp. H39-C1]